MLLCALAAGCDYLFNIDHIGPSDGAMQPTDIAGDAPGPSCGTPILWDRFDGPNICAPWGEMYLDLEARMVEDGQLVITPGRQASSIGGCVALAQHPFGSGVAVRVTEVVQGESTYTVLGIHGPNVQIKASGDGMLRFQTFSSVDLGTPIPYQPNMFWWRIRPEGLMAIVGEYSSDGASWTTLGTLTMPPPTMITPEISAGTNTTQVSGNGAFDQLLICRE
jgi:hypothetical protein